MKIDFLFVYGKLREYYADEANFDVESMVTAIARTNGTLYDLKGEAILIDSDEAFVYGNLVASTALDTLLRHTDAFMGFCEDDISNSRYIRVVKTAEIKSFDKKVKVWCYIMPSSRINDMEQTAKKIETGDWVQYLKEKELEKLSDKNDEK